MTTIEKINSRASLDRSPKKNWVDRAGGLPMYIRRIANHLHQEKGKTIGHAIAIAVNVVKKMCSSGDLNWPGKQSANAKSRAEACAAVASWERKKAGARVSKGDFGHKWSDEEFIKHLTGEVVVGEVIKSETEEIIKAGFDPNQKRGPLGMWVKAGSDVKDKEGKGGKNKKGSRRDKSFGVPKGYVSGSWKRIKGTGKKGVIRSTKVGIFKTKDGQWAVLVKKGQDIRVVGTFKDEKSASKRAVVALKANDKPYEGSGKKSSKKSSGSSSKTPSKKSSSSKVSSSRSTPKKKSTAKTGLPNPLETRNAKLRGKGRAVGGMIAKSVEITDEEFEELLSEIDTDSFSDADSNDEFDAVGKIEKKDTEKQLVFGWASIAKRADGTVVVDKQGDVLEDIDQMEKVAYDFVLHSRDGGEMHVRKGVSTLVESYVSTPEKNAAMGIPDGTLPTGWWVGFKVNDKDVWDKVKKKEYTMFSVHGSGHRTPVIAKDEN
jgi:hypothetical protein